MNRISIFAILNYWPLGRPKGAAFRRESFTESFSEPNAVKSTGRYYQSGKPLVALIRFRIEPVSFRQKLNPIIT